MERIESEERTYKGFDGVLIDCTSSRCFCGFPGVVVVVLFLFVLKNVGVIRGSRAKRG